MSVIIECYYKNIAFRYNYKFVGMIISSSVTNSDSCKSVYSVISLTLCHTFTNFVVVVVTGSWYTFMVYYGKNRFNINTPTFIRTILVATIIIIMVVTVYCIFA